MENVFDTSAQAETDTVQPEATDTAEESWDYYDPEEDTVEAEEDTATDDEGEAAETDPEAEEAAPEDETEQAEEEEAPAPELLELPDGTQIEREEAVKGYLRQSDYSRKTSEIAQLRESYTAASQRIESVTEALVDHLDKMVPPKPDLALLHTDPARYNREKALHEASLEQLQEIINAGSQAKEATQEVSQKETEQERARNFHALAEKFPQIRSEKGNKEFFGGVVEAAREFGLADELQGITDARVYEALHWANIGKKAHAARQKAKAKVAKAPPVAPNKPAQNAQVNRNKDAMRKLSKSGSIRDALKIDWD